MTYLFPYLSLYILHVASRCQILTEPLISKMFLSECIFEQHVLCKFDYVYQSISCRTLLGGTHENITNGQGEVGQGVLSYFLIEWRSFVQI